MSFPRYPKYKESAMWWREKVPQHWEVVPFGSAIQFQEGPGIMAADFREEGIPLLRVSGVQGRWATLDGCNYLEPRQVAQKWGHFRVNLGDVLISASASMGTVCEVGANTAGAIPYTGIIRLAPKPNRTTADFVRAIVVSNSFSTQIDLLKAGATIQHFGPTHLRKVRIALPPLEEQNVITFFLDAETEKLDLLISEQKRLLELLKEKRQTVISHAVTKGLNPQAPSKPSGIEWLGSIPAHWEVVQSRRLFRVRSEAARASDRQLTASQKYGMIFQSEFVELEGRRVVELIKGTDSLCHAEPNDFIISLRSFQGGLEWCKVAGSITFHYVVLVPVKLVHEPFFAYLFKSLAYIQALRATTNLIRDGQDLRYSNFVQVALPVIPLEEQAEIASYLDRETAKLDALIVEAERSIDLLQERRAALISAAVTGQIDVRSIVKKEAA